MGFGVGLLDPFAMPGMGSPSESTENEFLWGNRESAFYESGVIDSSATDAGSTPTTTLRPGLLMGIIASSSKYKQYDPTATDGSQIARAILRMGVDMSTPAGGTADKSGLFVLKGFVKNANVYNLDALARRQLFGHMLFDDDFVGLAPHYRLINVQTANYTVLTSDNDAIFSNKGATGAVTFTLPTLARGLHYQFVVEADETVTVSGAANTLVVYNNATATNIAFSTATKRVGAWIEVFANVDATKWLVKVLLGDPAQQETIS